MAAHYDTFIHTKASRQCQHASAARTKLTPPIATKTPSRPRHAAGACIHIHSHHAYCTNVQKNIQCVGEWASGNGSRIQLIDKSCKHRILWLSSWPHHFRVHSFRSCAMVFFFHCCCYCFPLSFMRTIYVAITQIHILSEYNSFSPNYKDLLGD